MTTSVGPLNVSTETVCTESPTDGESIDNGSCVEAADGYNPISDASPAKAVCAAMFGIELVSPG